jgi:hypothetical protein
VNRRDRHEPLAEETRGALPKSSPQARVPRAGRRVTTTRFAGLLTLGVLLAGCGAATTTAPSSAQPTVTATSAPTAASTPGSLLTVTSSIADGTSLATPMTWVATVAGQLTAPVDRVEFLIDGRLAWTEHNPPYFFNDDGNMLIPSVLDPGSHHLVIDVYTAAGPVATATATVTTSRPVVPASLAGKTFSHQPEGGPAWRYTFGADGVIRFDDASGSGGTEAFIATPDGELTLYGPANWIVAEDRRGSFCDGPEGITTMKWHMSGQDLTLSPMGLADRCPDRATNLTGAYQPTR